MRKRYKITRLVIALATILFTGISCYNYYVGQMLYKESVAHLQESYLQVNKTLELFVQRNWNFLSQWEEDLSDVRSEDDMENVWASLKNGKESWQYSDFYMFNEACEFQTAAGRVGVADNISQVVEEVYEKNEPLATSYQATTGKRKVVFARPLSEAVEVNGTSYTSLAVSYDASVVEKLIVSDLYEGASDCYIVGTDGEVILSLSEMHEVAASLSELCAFSGSDIRWKHGSAAQVEEKIEEGEKADALYVEEGESYYLVSVPTDIENWSILGIVEADEVDSGVRQIQKGTLLILGSAAVILMLILFLTIESEKQEKLRRKEKEKQELERKKEESERFFEGISRIVDRVVVVHLAEDRYEYHEFLEPAPLYQEKGIYSELIKKVSDRYVALKSVENAKLGRLIMPEYLKKVLKKPSDIMKVEYCLRNENVYKVLNAVPMEWDEEGNLTSVMLIAQDIGQKVELENMANTDGLTGLFNERYFSNLLRYKESKKIPFVLYYLDLDRFKPINDTYGHDTGDKVLQEIGRRLLSCIRNQDYAFRIGGDEFALIISMDFEETACRQMRERVCQMLSTPMEVEGKLLDVGVSCGFAAYPYESAETSRVRILADERMYEEKSKHHNHR